MTIYDLCDLFNVSKKAIHKYRERGILRPPYGMGPDRHATRNVYWGEAHVEDLRAYFALKHNNVTAKDAVRYCQETGITLREYVETREESIRRNGIGIG